MTIRYDAQAMILREEQGVGASRGSVALWRLKGAVFRKYVSCNSGY